MRKTIVLKNSNWNNEMTELLHKIPSYHINYNLLTNESLKTNYNKIII